MSASLTDKAKELLDQATYATVATVNPDGGPQTSVVWAGRDGDDVLISTTVGRAKERNWRRDPRASLMLIDPANPFSYVEVRGAVELTTDGGPELIQTLSHKYAGGPYTYDGPNDVRVVARLRPERVVSH